jgi:hypothetical protein
MAAVESSEAFLRFDGCAHPFALRAIAVSLGAGLRLPLIEERWNSPAALQII